MSILNYHNNNILYLNQVAIPDIVKQFNTPTYVYSAQQIQQNITDLQAAFCDLNHKFFYAVKANSNLSILNLIARHDFGFDIVSLGELIRVLKAGAHPKNIIFSGASKTTEEIIQAIKYGIYCFNVESIAEFSLINSLAKQLQRGVQISLRLNPNISANTHAHISTGLEDNKFGMRIEDIKELIKDFSANSYLQVIGISSHIGSQILELAPLIANVNALCELARFMLAQGMKLQFINLGGGFGIPYHQETPFDLAAYAKAIKASCASLNLMAILEPGRFVVGSAGVLLTKVNYIKVQENKLFALVDAGMNDLLRPALYDAWHDIKPIVLNRNVEMKTYDVVGPVCESADYLGKERSLSIAAEDYLAIDTVGAYGFSMSSNYNSRLRPAEVLIENKQIKLIRSRETIENLLLDEEDLLN